VQCRCCDCAALAGEHATRAVTARLTATSRLSLLHDTLTAQHCSCSIAHPLFTPGCCCAAQAGCCSRPRAAAW
jgi:hypothetical protein